MRGHTYFDLALRYEIELCADSCGEPGHRRGWVDPDGMVHWDAHRKTTRSGIRRFLMLVHEAQRRTNDDAPVFWARRPALERRAMSIHAASVFASRTALHDLGIRLPAYLARHDKANVRALLVDAPSELRRSRVGRWAGLR